VELSPSMAHTDSHLDSKWVYEGERIDLLVADCEERWTTRSTLGSAL
jgi:hypothetical protein